jgi:hypothetical protein
VYPFEIGSTGDLACGFIHKIKDLLADRAEPINDDHEWNDELESLRQTLILTELARQTFEYTPLGRNLAKCIYPNVEQCCAVLQQLFNDIHSSGCRQAQSLFSTKLSAYRILLGQCMMPFNSCVYRSFALPSKASDCLINMKC